MKRRNFIKNTTLAGMGLPLTNILANNIYTEDNFISNRPTLNKRTFTSEAVEDLIVFKRLNSTSMAVFTSNQKR